MDNIKIVQTRQSHVDELLQELSTLNGEDAYRFGLDKKEIIYKACKRSIYIKTAILDGKVIAIWGVLGTYLGEVGRPWSLMSPDTEKYPFRFKSFYKHELDKMLQLFPTLVDMVDIKHEKALRMLKIMGFKLGKPEPFLNGTFIKAERNRQ